MCAAPYTPARAVPRAERPRGRTFGLVTPRRRADLRAEESRGGPDPPVCSSTYLLPVSKADKPPSWKPWESARPELGVGLYGVPTLMGASLPNRGQGFGARARA